MRFLVDECTGPLVALWLREHNHDVFSVYDEARGLSDDKILEKAVADDRILITNDKDFGEMIFRQGREHRGVILLRLEDERPANKTSVIERLLKQYSAHLAGHFVVATQDAVRIAGSQLGDQ